MIQQLEDIKVGNYYKIEEESQTYIVKIVFDMDIAFLTTIFSTRRPNYLSKHVVEKLIKTNKVKDLGILGDSVCKLLYD
jgi:hypothetical protein